MKDLFKGNFAYVKNSKYLWMFAGGLILICLILNLILGTSVDVTFKGGTLAKFAYEGDLTEKAVVDYLNKDFKLNALDVQLSEATASGSDEKYQLINIYTTDELGTDEVTKLADGLTKNFAANKLTQDSINSIQSTMGKMFFLKCMVAVAIAAVVLIIYVGLRFRKIGGWPAGVMAMVALLHDLTIAYFAFVLFRIPLNDNFVAVVLTILGYSLNGTIVVYDRVRANRRKMRAPLAEVANVSLNETFKRNLNTFITTFLAIATVAVVAFVENLDAIISFAVPMAVGVVAGFFSSTFLCIPAWVAWMNKREAKKAAKERSGGKK